MTNYLACKNADGTVTVASTATADRIVDPPWVIVDAAGLGRLKAEAAAEFVPRSISARQIRLWLVQNGKTLAAVESAIDGIQDQQARDSVRVEWEYAPVVERSHPWLVPLAAALGLTEAQVDAAFREAATL